MSDQITNLLSSLDDTIRYFASSVVLTKGNYGGYHCELKLWGRAYSANGDTYEEAIQKTIQGIIEQALHRVIGEFKDKAESSINQAL